MKAAVTILYLLTIAILHGGTPGSSPSNAILLSSGATGIVGNLVRDTDVQWYRFLAAPSLVYTVRVDNVSLWDSDLSLRVVADGADAASTNSVFQPQRNSTVVWTNSGGLRHYYIAVSALLQFTTGTYTVAVSANDRDTDGDGLADAWESLYFGGPTNAVPARWNASGTTNWTAFATGANPNDPLAALRISRVIARPTGTEIHWPSVPYSAYRVESSTNLLRGAGWTQRMRLVTGAAAGPRQFSDEADARAPRFYRVVYETD